MDVYLVRHAKSLYDWSKYPTDNVRPLSKKGIERQRCVSKGMIKENIKFESAWVSPYRRAQETLEIIQAVYSVQVPIVIIDELIPGGSEEKVLELLVEQSKETPTLRLLIVGHNPLLSDLVELIDEYSVIDMKTSDIAHCTISETSYKLVSYFNREELMQS